MTRSRRTQVIASVALLALLVGSLSARTASAALSTRTPLGRSQPPSLTMGHSRRNPSGGLSSVGPAGSPVTAGSGRWVALPAGLRAALAHLHLGRGSHAVRDRGPRPPAAQPACACGGGGGGGATWSQQAELTASDGVYNDQFGDSVALSGDGGTALIFAAAATNRPVYVYVLSGGAWVQQAELTDSSGGHFSGSLALSSDGNTALISGLDGTGTEAVYVLGRSGATWSQTAELTASDGHPDDLFGASVALSSDGGTALIGAPDVNVEGAAYVFARNGGTWSQTAELTAPNAVPYIDDLGISVALSGDGGTALVGDPNGNNGTGAAYLYALSGGTWSQQAELTAGDAANGDNFGWSVALGSNGSAGPVALIGAPNKNNYTGAAYVFAPFFGWTQQAELTAADGMAFDAFGTSVALSSNGSTSAVALIGAYYRNSGTGAAYVFEDQGSFGPWTQAQTLTASDGTIGNSFGQSVALSSDGGTALIGALYANAGAGAAYIFSTATPPTPTNTPIPPTPTKTPTPKPTATATPKPSPKLGVLPSSTHAGAPITISGSGFGANETVTIKYNCGQPACTSTTVLGTPTTNASGAFSVLVTLPASTSVGTHSMGGKGNTTGDFATTTVTIT